MRCTRCDGEITPSGMGGAPCTCPPEPKPTIDDVRRGVALLLSVAGNAGPGCTSPTLAVSVTEGVDYGEEGASSYTRTHLVATAVRPDGELAYLDLDSIADYDDDVDLLALMEAFARLDRPLDLQAFWRTVRG